RSRVRGASRRGAGPSEAWPLRQGQGDREDRRQAGSGRAGEEGIGEEDGREEGARKEGREEGDGEEDGRPEGRGAQDRLIVWMQNTRRSRLAPGASRPGAGTDGCGRCR